MIEEAPIGALTTRIAGRLRELRAERGLSLDALAARSGVSRSMISLIERDESNPTAVVLDRIATGLDVPLAALFEPTTGPVAEPVARARDQVPWRDPHSGYVRRNVSPSGVGSPIQIVEVSFPPHAHVAYESSLSGPAVHQQVWVLDGVIEITLDEVQHRLESGDCLAMVLDRPVAFHNPTGRTTRYAVVIVSSPDSWR